MKVRVGALNFRRSSNAPDKGTSRDWERRDVLLADFLENIPSGPPGVLLASEVTREQQDYICRQFDYKAYGNGAGGHPKDIAGDNVAVFYDPDAYRLIGAVSASSKGSGSDVRWSHALLLERDGKRAWFAAVHLTSGSENGPLRARETELILSGLKSQGVDLTRTVWGGDINSSTPASKVGVRQVVAKYGLHDCATKMDEGSLLMSTFTGWDAAVERTGRHIDAIFVGKGIAIRRASVVPVTNLATDHHLVLGNLTI